MEFEVRATYYISCDAVLEDRIINMAYEQYKAKLSGEYSIFVAKNDNVKLAIANGKSVDLPTTWDRVGGIKRRPYTIPRVFLISNGSSDTMNRWIIKDFLYNGPCVNTTVVIVNSDISHHLFYFVLNAKVDHDRIVFEVDRDSSLNPFNYISPYKNDRPTPRALPMP